MPAVRIDPALAQRRTAQVMAQAQRDIPLFHVSKDAAAETLQELARQRGVSFTAALLPLIARWLGRHPRLNAHWNEGIEIHDRVDLGIAWAHGPNVLVVPVLRDCAGWSDGRFADAMSALRRRAREDRFEATDFAVPTFTVSNLGAMGIDAFTSLVTPPQVAVLSVAATSLRPVQRDGELTLGQVLTLTLGVDHRAIDGATAARALADLIDSLEADHA